MAGNEMFHHVIYGNALKDLYSANLHQCPTPGRLQILDVGCGSGYWCREMAEKHTGWEVHGIDLFVNDPHPARDFQNCEFHMPVDFTQNQWSSFREGTFDLIRATRLCGSVPDWNHLYWCMFRWDPTSITRSNLTLTCI